MYTNAKDSNAAKRDAAMSEQNIIHIYKQNIIYIIGDII